MIRNLETFIAVARVLNFGEAAKMLSYSQSTISDQIRLLEQELGVRLFERIGRRVFLTTQGELLVPAAKRLVKDAANLKNLFRSEAEMGGVITIAAAESLCTYWLPQLLKAYRQLYPNVHLNIRVGSCVDFPQWLQQDLVDVAFSLRNEYRKPQLVEDVLFNGQTVFIAAPDHALAQAAPFELELLSAQTLLVPEGHAGYPQELKLLLADRQIRVEHMLEFGSLETIKQCVKNGLGISLLPELAVAEEIRRGELVKLAWKEPMLIKAIMVFHRDKWLSPPLAAFKQLVLSNINI